MNKTDNHSLYRISFLHAETVLELYVKAIYQSDLPHFIEVEGLCFSEKTALVSEPNVEKVKKLFAGVKRTFIPLAAIQRIDELDIQAFSDYQTSQGELTGVSHFAHSLLQN